MTIRVNWNQGKAPGLIRAHQILNPQPKECQFEDMKGDFKDFISVALAEAEMKESNYKKYKHCSYCWDGKIIDPIP